MLNKKHKKRQQSILFSQIKAILINNLIINHRCWLFWKQTTLTIFILIIAIIEIQIEISFNPKLILFSYNVLAMVFIARSSVMVHMDNRHKFLYFQKAYGLNSAAYTLAWVLYSLVMGALKFIIYILIIYIYLKINDNHFSQYFQLYKNQNFFVTYQDTCLINFLTYLSMYSYCLLIAIIIEHNQIGLKLLTPILIIGYICLFDETYFIEHIDIKKLTWVSPTGWFASISYYHYQPIEKSQPLDQDIFYSKEKYVSIFLLQFFVPLGLSFIIELLKIYRFQIKKFVIETFKKSSIDSQIMSLTQSFSDSYQKTKKTYLIKIEKLWKRQKQDILKDINLSINQSEIIILYGKNGSGKSTLLNILTNIDAISSGNILFSKKIHFGVSLQDNFFEDQLTVKQNFYFYAKLKGIELDASDNYYLQRFQLVDFCNKTYNKISGGSKKKLSLACAFIGQNDVILLDEPTMGIDCKVKQEIQSILLKQKQHNKHLTIIISTCSLEFNFIQFANRFWIIDQGQIVLDEAIQDVNYRKKLIFGKISNMNLHNHMKQFLLQLQQLDLHSLKELDSQLILIFEQERLEPVIQIIKQYKLENKFSFSLAKTKDILSFKIDELLNSNQNTQRLENLNFQSIKFKLKKLKKKQTFLSLFIASFTIRYYQTISNILDLIYYISVPFFWGLIVWLLENSDNQIKFFGSIQLSYSDICTFIYPHIAAIHIQYKENGYEGIIFKMGMKKIPYWIASYLFNIIILLIPLLVFLIAFVRQASTIFNIFLYTMPFVSMSYFCTIFFKSDYVCFSFLPIVLTIINHFTLNLQKRYEGIKILLQIFLPNFQFSLTDSQEVSALQLTIVFVIEFFVYSIIFFLVNLALYRRKSSNKIMRSSEMIQDTYEGDIEEKLKVLDVTLNKNEYPNISLILSNVYLKYQKNVTIIKGLNLSIQEGTIFGLLGMNGSGKSTIIKLITNEVFKTLGDIYYNQKQILCQTSPIYQQISICPQYSYLMSDMTVNSHLRIICSLKGITQSKELIKLYLKLFKMEDQKCQRIMNLSGGSKRKLKIISTIIGKPKFILLDQPTIGIDQQTNQFFGKLLIFLTKDLKSTCIYITHKLQEVERYCSKLGIVKRGGLVLTGHISELIDRYSRGYEIKFYSLALQQLKNQFIQQLQEKFNVFQLIQSIQTHLLSALVPFQQNSFQKCVNIILHLRKNRLTYGYELKKEGLIEVFNYLVNQDETSLILTTSKTN